MPMRRLPGLVAVIVSLASCQGRFSAAPAPRVLAAPEPVVKAVSSVQPQPAPLPIGPDELPEDERALYDKFAHAAHLLERTYEVRATRWTADHAHLAFLANRDGGWRAYLSGWRNVALPPAPLENVPPSAQSLCSSPDSRWLVVSSGSSANADVVRVDIVDGSVRVVPELKATSELLCARRQQPLVLVPTHSPAGTTITQVHLEHLDRKALGTLPGRCELLDIAPQSDRLVARCTHEQQHTLVEVRLASGAQRTIATATAPGLTAAFAGSWLLVVTPEDRSVVVGYRDRAAPLKVRLPYECLQMTASMLGDRLALLAHDQGQMKLSVVDWPSARVRAAVPLPAGAGKFGPFTSDGGTVVIDWQTPIAPSDPYELDVNSGALQPLRTNERPRLALLPGVTIEHEELPLPALHHTPTQRVHAQLVRPQHPGSPRPVVVLPVTQGTFLEWSPLVRLLSSEGPVLLVPLSNGAGDLSMQETLAAVRATASSRPWGQAGQVLLGVGPWARQTVGALADSEWLAVVALPLDEPGPAPAPPQLSGTVPPWLVVMQQEAPDDWKHLIRAVRERGAQVTYAHEPGMTAPERPSAGGIARIGSMLARLAATQ